jgi:hypothetical protein
VNAQYHFNDEKIKADTKQWENIDGFVTNHPIKLFGTYTTVGFNNNGEVSYVATHFTYFFGMHIAFYNEEKLSKNNLFTSKLKRRGWINE